MRTGELLPSVPSVLAGRGVAARGAWAWACWPSIRGRAIRGRGAGPRSEERRGPPRRGFYQITGGFGPSSAAHWQRPRYRGPGWADATVPHTLPRVGKRSGTLVDPDNKAKFGWLFLRYKYHVCEYYEFVGMARKAALVLVSMLFGACHLGAFYCIFGRP